MIFLQEKQSERPKVFHRGKPEYVVRKKQHNYSILRDIGYIIKFIAYIIKTWFTTEPTEPRPRGPPKINLNVSQKYLYFLVNIYYSFFKHFLSSILYEKYSFAIGIELIFMQDIYFRWCCQLYVSPLIYCYKSVSYLPCNNKARATKIILH